MKKNILLIVCMIGVIASIAVGLYMYPVSSTTKSVSDVTEEGVIVSGSFDPALMKPDDYWRSLLTSDQYYILREKGTERPFTGELLENKKPGVYESAGCGLPVFRSEAKYDSGTGWPSFTAPVSPDAVVLLEDYELGYKRIEVRDKCGGHLGHVFDDGPPPTGKRYCINSDALKFVPDSM